MASNSSLDLVNLDFGTMKASLASYLKTQDQFKDYNFDGSAMNVLLDLLSYNTFKNAFYLNMIHSEGFLDSAQLKDSVYSHAKELNYLPRSARSSVANVSIQFTADNSGQPYVIRKGETFSAIVNQGAYSFSIATDQILTSASNTFSATFDIYEGIYVTDSYVINHSDTMQKFKITNQSVDTNSLVVLVYENGDTNGTTYKRATTLLDLNEKSEVYFIQASTGGGYEVLFGDGILGKLPNDGSVVVLDYRVTAGAVANGAKGFSPNFDPSGSGAITKAMTVSVNPYTPTTNGLYSVSGADAESIESVRYHAPRHFQTQERAITAGDYSILLKSQFPEIGAIAVYGGEEANPPRYGKVFVSVDIKNVTGLPESKKLEYYSFLKSRSPLSIDPIFIEPEFSFIQVNSLVKYNINNTTRTAQNLQASIVLNVNEFADTYLNDFNAKLRYSKLVQSIDSVDTSIVSNETDLVLYKKLNPTIDKNQNFVINFNIPLQQTDYVNENMNAVGASVHKIRVNRTITSTTFNFAGDKCIVEDDGVGIIRIVKTVGNYHYVIKNVGTVDYITGELRLNSFTVSSYDGSALKIYAKARDKDIIGSKNEVMSIESDEINVKIEAIRE
jgi:hypothetical protein